MRKMWLTRHVTRSVGTRNVLLTGLHCVTAPRWNPVHTFELMLHLDKNTYHTQFTRFVQTSLTTTVWRLKLTWKILMTHWVPNINYIATAHITQNSRLSPYSPPNMIRVLKSDNEMSWEYSTYGEIRCAYRVWVGTWGKKTTSKS